MSAENIQALVRLVRGNIVVEECAYFPDTANVNVLLQRLGADANRRFKPQMLLAKEREERELQERMRQEEQASNAVLSSTPQIFASEPPTIQAVHSMGEAPHLFQHVNTNLDRLAFAMQEMNKNQAILQKKFAEIEQKLQCHDNLLKNQELESIIIENTSTHAPPSRT